MVRDVLEDDLGSTAMTGADAGTVAMAAV